VTLADALAALGSPHDVAREEYRQLVRDDNPDTIQRDRYRSLVIRLASEPPRSPATPRPAPPVQSIRLAPRVAAAAGVAAVAVDMSGEWGVRSEERKTPCCGG